jgi:hypothetical protein
VNRVALLDFLRGGTPAVRRNGAFRARALGTALRTFAQQPATWALVKDARFLDSGRRIDSFESGGCFLLAEAFGRWAGPAAELVATRIFDEHRAYSVMVHVLVRLGDVYFDARGARTAREVLDEGPELNDPDDAPWIASFTTEDAETDGIGCPVVPLRRLAKALAGALGDPRSWDVPTAPPAGMHEGLKLRRRPVQTPGGGEHERRPRNPQKFTRERQACGIEEQRPRGPFARQRHCGRTWQIERGGHQGIAFKEKCLPIGNPIHIVEHDTFRFFDAV